MIQEVDGVNVRIEVVTADNVGKFYPDLEKQSPGDFRESKKELEVGISFALVAIDTKTNRMIASVWGNRKENNLITINTKPKYRRRGIATQLVKQLQNNPVINNLTLDNIAGVVGQEFYKKMGFVLKPNPLNPNRMVWQRKNIKE